MRVAIVAEFYPRAADPVLGIWAHRQAQAAQAAGADVEVLVLHRPIPPSAALRAGPATALRQTRTMLAQPRHETRDGIPITYVSFVSPPRPTSYATWGAWAAPPLALALRRLRRRFAFDLIHAHNAVPTAEAVHRARIDVPVVTSVHGGDVFYTAVRSPQGARAVTHGLTQSRLVLANSSGVADLCSHYGARAVRVVHLGADSPRHPAKPADAPTLVTLGHVVDRKRHADVIRALWLLRDRFPTLRYDVIGDGPARAAATALAEELGVAERVTWHGQLDHATALDTLTRATLMVMPSVDEAFGVAYIEALAAGLPAIGSIGEPGPTDIAAAGPGMLLVAPGDIEALANAIADTLSDERALRTLRTAARTTAAAAFSWEACGAATVAAYEQALR